MTAPPKLENNKRRATTARPPVNTTEADLSIFLATYSTKGFL
jgi:hypothetical protein